MKNLFGLGGRILLLLLLLVMMMMLVEVVAVVVGSGKAGEVQRSRHIGPN